LLSVVKLLFSSFEFLLEFQHLVFLFHISC
jgi:hypothetical protein